MDAGVSAGLEQVVSDAVSDLCSRLGVGTDEVTVIAAESVTWPDRSLGCPHPDMAYLQVLVDGARVLLEVGARTYAYHCGGERGPFLCESPASDGH